MAAVAGFPPPTNWSDCSLSDLNTGFTAHNTDRCLTNEPTMNVADPVCGNGVRESDEICDCGGETECTDPCCNATTCQLVSGAQCGSGSCCSRDCTIVPYGIECRTSSGECDIAEYCSGDSSECPRDDQKFDSTPCANNTGYCYFGKCPTYDAQCMRAFGMFVMKS